MIDIVTVYHNDKNELDARKLLRDLMAIEPENFKFYAHSNKDNNLGFSKGCNIGASKGSSEIIGFLNPDVIVHAPFIKEVEDLLTKNKDIKITGCRFNKPAFELKIWGVKEWVCGATFFVKRDWFEKMGGFDERYEWSHEETDFILATEKQGGITKPLNLPLEHASPSDDNEKDRVYKETKFEEAREAYKKKWNFK